MSSKKALKSDQRRGLVRHILGAFKVSEQWLCQAAEVRGSVPSYQFRTYNQAVLRKRIREIAATRVRYRYKRIHLLLRREGLLINTKRFYRLYCEEGLYLSNKWPRRQVSAAHRQERILARPPNKSWSMGFI